MNKSRKIKSSEKASHSKSKDESRVEFLPDPHRMLAKCEFRDFHSSLGSFGKFGELDHNQRGILSFALHLMEGLLQYILCSGTILESLHELDNDIYSYQGEKRSGGLNLSFKVISTEKKGFTLLPLDYKGFNKSNYGSSKSKGDRGENIQDDDPLVPPKEYLEIIGYKEPITKATVFQFPCDSSPEDLITEKCIMDVIRRRVEDKGWLSQLELVCKWMGELAKAIRHLVKHFPVTYKRFLEESNGRIYASLRYPLFYMAFMKLLFDEYPMINETNEELNSKDPGDARRLVNRIRRNRLPGMRLIEIMSRITSSFGSALESMGGSRVWACDPKFAQYYLHMAFVFDESSLFTQISAKSYMFDYEIFEWNYTLNSLAQHIPLLNAFLKPLATSIMANRVQSRLAYYLKDSNKNTQTDDKTCSENNKLPMPVLGNSLEARFLTSEVIKRSTAFFGNFEGDRLISSVKAEFENWQYKPIRPTQEIKKLESRKVDLEKTLKEYNRTVLVPEKKIRHTKTVINHILPPLTHISEKKKNLMIKIAPGQKYAQSFYNNKVNIPAGMVVRPK
ncbi:hypothetical protein OJ253_1104 [Cryptosporidium canis]|uniref:Uncharacterized protein n=1 Tax=Cryptosporidium canis TaxID=195482 RepID=A0A9D5DKR5_9CRYT|nr:hypothetical protein OJ253_1104 [Cryptosporidium canis]